MKIDFTRDESCLFRVACNIHELFIKYFQGYKETIIVNRNGDGNSIPKCFSSNLYLDMSFFLLLINDYHYKKGTCKFDRLYIKRRAGALHLEAVIVNLIGSGIQFSYYIHY